VVHADAAIQVALQLSRTDGAEHKFGEKALWWGRRGGGLVVETDRDTYTVGKVVLAAGPWITELASLDIELTAARQPLLWLSPVGRSETFTSSQFPVYLWQRRDRTIFYGFPLDETGLKVARHHRGERTAPATLDRAVSDPDVEIVRSFLADAIPSANGRFITGSVCMYTNAPDGHFVIDRLPSDDDVIIVSPCSGHGFKFAPAIGELVADIVGAEASTGDSPFRIDRDVVSDPIIERRPSERRSDKAEPPA
jgi:sarcosine oxidase